MQNYPISINKDERRLLIDWAGGSDIRAVKAVEILEEAVVGDHYHRYKDEMFLLLKGKFIHLEVGALLLFNVEAPYRIFVPKLTYHKFICEKGSILLGVATKEFDPNDEVKPEKTIINEHF
jgi:quercetin dioxygenase-like cupin family protein